MSEESNVSEASPLWYPIEALGMMQKPVRFLLHGGVATGVLVDNKTYSVLRDDGRLDPLPYQPLGWRPLAGQSWPESLPQPITLSSSGRFTDVRPHKLRAMARQADDADRVRKELEQELGGDEQSQGTSGPATMVRGGKKGQWWLDPGRVTYSMPGHISLAEAEARISRAILTDGLTGRDAPEEFAGTASGLRQLVAEAVHSSDGDVRPRFDPTPRDVDDYLTAMRWFALIAPPELAPDWAKPRPNVVDENKARASLQSAAVHRAKKGVWLSGAQKVLVFRALLPPLSWRQIARRAGGSQEGWRKAWGGALEMVRRVANDEPAMRHVSVADQLAALKERNKSARRA